MPLHYHDDDSIMLSFQKCSKVIVHIFSETVISKRPSRAINVREYCINGRVTCGRRSKGWKLPDSHWSFFVRIHSLVVCIDVFQCFYYLVGFEVLKPETMMSLVFRVVTLRSSETAQCCEKYITSIFTG